MSKHAITLDDLKAIAGEEAVTFSIGDILLVRTGWIKWYEENDEEDRLKYITNGKAWVGVEGCHEILEWLWNQHFSAVAGDSIGWEVVSSPILERLCCCWSSPDSVMIGTD
jgi:kynurenine formamidase